MLIFDGDCGFCRRSVGWARRLGATCEFRPSYAVDLAALGLTEEDAVAAAWFVGTGGQLFRGHEAVAQVLLGSRWAAVRVAGRLVASRVMWPVAGRVYQWVADHRGRLTGGGPTCSVD